MRDKYALEFPSMLPKALIELTLDFLPSCSECSKFAISTCQARHHDMKPFLCDECSIMCSCGMYFHKLCVTCHPSAAYLRQVKEIERQFHCLEGFVCSLLIFLIGFIFLLSGCNPNIVGGCPVRTFIPNASLVNVSIENSSSSSLALDQSEIVFRIHAVYNYSLKESQYSCLDLFVDKCFSYQEAQQISQLYPRHTSLIHLPSGDRACLSTGKGWDLWLTGTILTSIGGLVVLITCCY